MVCNYHEWSISKFQFLEKYELDRIQFLKMACEKKRKSKHYGVSGPVSFCARQVLNRFFISLFILFTSYYIHIIK